MKKYLVFIAVVLFVNGCNDDREDSGKHNQPNNCTTDLNGNCIEEKQGAICNNGIAEESEQCDTNDFRGWSCADYGEFHAGTLSCTAMCTVDTSKCIECTDDEHCATNIEGRTICKEKNCVIPPVCGDGELNGEEECYGKNLDGKKCSDFDQFVGGNLKCNKSCEFDTSECVECTKKNLELCFEGQVCSNEGRCVEPDHVIQCNDGVAEGSEQCDLEDFRGKSCADLGNYHTGTLSCTNICTIDVSKCVECSENIHCAANLEGETICSDNYCMKPPFCGDGDLNGDESCEGLNLNGKGCGDFDQYVSGTLKCNNSCEFDISECVECTKKNLELCLDGQICSDDGKCIEPDHVIQCNDGVAEGSEQCDIDDFKGKTCADYGNFHTGSLSCTHKCAIDTSKCIECTINAHCATNTNGKTLCNNNECVLPPYCGDGIINADEDCEGNNLNGYKCSDFNQFVGGTLKCNSSCNFNTSGCVECTHKNLEQCLEGQVCSSEGKCIEPDHVIQCNDGIAEGSEQCDITDFRGKTCSDFDGYHTGTLSCTPFCTIETVRCLECTNNSHCSTNSDGKTKCENNTCVKPPTCGDGIRNGSEYCDKTDLNNQSCISLGGFAGGTLKCNASCNFDTSECVVCTKKNLENCLDDQVCSDEGKCVEAVHEITCGDKLAEGTEDCDGNDLQGKTCADVSDNKYGILSCGKECKYDISQCIECESDDNCFGREDGKTICYLNECIIPSPCDTGQTYLPKYDMCAINITTKSDFLALRDNWNAGNQNDYLTKEGEPATFFIVNNISLGIQTNWIGIGTNTNPFIGRIVGNDKTITASITCQDNDDACGIFDYAKNPYIVNLNIKVSLNATNSTTYVGSLIGYLQGGTFESINFNNNISYTNSANLGGIIGFNDSKELSMSNINYDGDIIFNEKSVQPMQRFVGGFIGRTLSKTVIKESSITGKQEFKINETITFCGGNTIGSVIGAGDEIYLNDISSSVNINIEENTCSKNCNCTPSGWYEQGARIGGMIGQASKVKGDYLQFIGNIDYSQLNSNSHHYITYIGGFFGYLSTSLELDKSKVNSSLKSNSFSAGSFIIQNRMGGVAGFIPSCSIKNTNIINNYSGKSYWFSGGIGYYIDNCEIANVGVQSSNIAGVAYKLSNSQIINSFLLNNEGSTSYVIAYEASSCILSYSYYKTGKSMTYGTDSSIMLDHSYTYSLNSDGQPTLGTQLVLDRLNVNLINKIAGLPEGTYLPWIENSNKPVLNFDSLESEWISIP